MTRTACSVVLVLLATAPGCSAPAAKNSDLEKKVEALEKKVDGLEKKVDGIGAGGGRKQPPPQAEVYTIPSGDSPTTGSKDAKNELAIFADFECPPCGGAEPKVMALLKDPEMKDTLRVTFHHFPLPFHKNARPAAKASMAVREVGGDSAFWLWAAKAFANQKALTSDNFRAWAKEAGVALDKYEKALKENEAKYEETIVREMELGKTAAKVRGTPAIYVNGWEMRNSLSPDDVKAFIKEKETTAKP